MTHVMDCETVLKKSIVVPPISNLVHISDSKTIDYFSVIMIQTTLSPVVFDFVMMISAFSDSLGSRECSLALGSHRPHNTQSGKPQQGQNTPRQ